MTHGDLETDLQDVRRHEGDTQFEDVLRVGSEQSSPPCIDSYETNGSTDSSVDMGAIALKISASLDAQEILQAVADAALEAICGDRAVLYGLKETGADRQCLPWETKDVLIAAEAIASTTLPITQEQPLFLVGSADIMPLIWPDSTQDAELGQIISSTDVAPPLAQEWSRYNIESTLAIPLVCDRFWVGALAVQRCHPAPPWTRSDRQRLRQIVLHAQTMLTHASTHWQVTQLNFSLTQQVRKNAEQVNIAIEFESTLKRITDSVRDSLDEGEILQTAVRELTELLGLGGCNAALYNLNRGTSTICYEYTNFIPASRGRVAQMNDFPELYNQLRGGLYFQFCSLIPNPKRGRVAMLACPVFVDSERDANGPHKVLGDLWLVHHKDHVFSNLEVRLVQQVANQCAIAIRQARLYQAVQAQVHELERLNRLKDEFLSTVSHELRTPISNVKMAIHMLKNSTDAARQKRYLDILETESRREANLINDLLDLQKLETAQLPIHVKTLDLQDWLPTLIEPFDSRFISRCQAFTLSCSSALSDFSTDFDVLQRILSELINNACKYTATDHAIELRVTPYTATNKQLQNDDKRCGALVVFEVRNQVEIPESELPHLFDKFYRVPHADIWNQGGTGLGLALVQKLVHQIGGTIEVESCQGWTTFSVVVPQQPRP